MGEGRFGKDAFRVILDGFQGVLAVADSHDDATVLRDSRDCKVCREAAGARTERVVTGGFDALRNVLEASPAIMANGADLPVLDLARIAMKEVSAYASERSRARE